MKNNSPRVVKNIKEEEGSLIIRGDRPYTEHEIKKLAKIDMKFWKKVDFVVNSWDVTNKKGEKHTNWQSKLKLKKREKTIIALEDSLKEFKKLMRNYKPSSRKINPMNVVKRNYAGEMALYDVHLGKFAWYKETLQGNWDLEIASKAFLNGVRSLLEHLAPYVLEKIFFPIGNDIVHAENMQPLTPKSRHVLDVDGRLPKNIAYLKQTIIKAIDLCLQIAPVEIIWVPGNHDPHASHWLCHILEAWYRSVKHVEVDLSPSIHKARLWGNLLVGFTHAAHGAMQNRAINMLPQFWPEEWGKSKYRELHTGHKHQKATIRTFPVLTSGGTIIRQLPTLSPIDFWHLESLFIDAVPASQAFLWDKTSGIIAEYTEPTDMHKKESVYTLQG